MSANRSKRQIAGIVSLFALSSLTLFGCGGGGSSSIVNTPTRATVASTPGNIQEAGGIATYTLDINQQVDVDPSTVLINVHSGFLFPLALGDPQSASYQANVATLVQEKDNSVSNGPQVMTLVHGVKNRFTYQVTFPAAPSMGPSGPFYAYFTAKDTKGNPINIAYINGTNENSFIFDPSSLNPGSFNSGTGVNFGTSPFLLPPASLNGGPVSFNGTLTPPPGK